MGLLIRFISNLLAASICVQSFLICGFLYRPPNMAVITWHFHNDYCQSSFIVCIYWSYIFSGHYTQVTLCLTSACDHTKMVACKNVTKCDHFDCKDYAAAALKTWRLKWTRRLETIALVARRSLVTVGSLVESGRSVVESVQVVVWLGLYLRLV